MMVLVSIESTLSLEACSQFNGRRNQEKGEGVAAASSRKGGLFFLSAARRMAMRFRRLLVAATVTTAVWLAAPAWADRTFFSTNGPDGLLGALSQPPSPGNLETETADD